MSRILNIISDTRVVLGDPNGLRYPTDTLISLVNQALRRICLAANLLKTKSYVKLENNTAIYNLSPYALKIDRIEYLDKNIELKDSIELDKLDPDWHNTTGDTVQYIVMDNTSNGKFYIYPKLTNNVLNNITSNSLYGGIIDITVTDGLFELPVDTIGSYSYKYLTVYYTKKPDTVTIDTTDEEFEVDSAIDDAIMYFVTGFALRLDNDTLNRQFGVEQLQLFETSMTELKNKQSNSNNNLNYKEIPYKGFI